MIFSWMCIILVILQSFLQLDMALDAGFGPLDLNNLPTSNLERQFPVVALTNKEPWRTHIDIAFRKVAFCLCSLLLSISLFVRTFVYSPTHSLPHSPTDPLIHCIHTFLYYCIHTFIKCIPAIMHSLVYLFIPLFIT